MPLFCSVFHFVVLFLNQGFSNKKYEVLIQESTVYLAQTTEESEQM